MIPRHASHGGLFPGPPCWCSPLVTFDPDPDEPGRTRTITWHQDWWLFIAHADEHGQPPA